ncbi:hypothetical protein J3A83DRAFT_4191257 [Scleroderma citrinum]
MPQKHKVTNEDANGLDVTDHSKQPRAEEPPASTYLNENATVQWSSCSGRGTRAQDLLYLVLQPYNPHPKPNQPSVWQSPVIGSDLGYQALVELEARLGPVVMNHQICPNLHPMLALTSLVVLPALPQLLPLMHHQFAHHLKGILGQASKLMFSKLDGPTSPPHPGAILGLEPDENDPEVNMNNDEHVDETSLSDEERFAEAVIQASISQVSIPSWSHWATNTVVQYPTNPEPETVQQQHLSPGETPNQPMQHHLWEDLGNWHLALRKKACIFGHTNNLAHPVLSGLIIDFFYTGSLSVRQLFPEVFGEEVPRVAIAIAATALKVGLNKMVSSQGKVSFQVSTYTLVYLEMLGLMDKQNHSDVNGQWLEGVIGICDRGVFRKGAVEEFTYKTSAAVIARSTPLRGLSFKVQRASKMVWQQMQKEED